MLVLAPSGASLSYIITNIMYSLSVTAGSLPAGQPYALVTSAVVFGLLVVIGMDKVILEEGNKEDSKDNKEVAK